MKLVTLTAAAAVLAAGAAQAHVTVQPATAPAGGFQVLRFGVGHGCGGKATTALTIQIPPAIASAHPQPKPGWTLSVEHPPGAPHKVSAITWRGELADDEFDEFLIHAPMPATAGPLAFPAVQTCGAEQIRWDGSPRPAPSVVVLPAEGNP